MLIDFHNLCTTGNRKKFATDTECFRQRFATVAGALIMLFDVL